MSATAAPIMADEKIRTLSILKEGLIAAPPKIVWESIVAELESFDDHRGNVMKFKFEQFPGGRLFRDLGNDAGHLWAHVQVIKPAKVLELVGPMFMSFPVSSHVQYKLTPEGEDTRLVLHHRAVGLIPDEMSESVTSGWGMVFDSISARSTARSKKK